VHERDEHGVFAVHGYPIGDGTSTFIVETDEPTWRAAGLDAFDVTGPPGPSDLRSRDHLQELFADHIDGRPLLVNNSRWGNFRTRRTRRWSVLDPRPVALLGDAVHTAHFSVGSGTKMAMEDAVALSAALVAHPGDLPAALAGYEAAARPSVEEIQDSARPSLAWWERFGHYHDHFAPWQFAYHFLSRAITDARLARRAPEFVAATHRSWRAEHGAEPLESALAVGGRTLPGRWVAVEGTAFRGADGAALPAARLAAPDDESGLAAATARLDELVGGGAGLVAVHGGAAFTRTLLTERVRMHHGLPALLVDPGLDRDRAVTAVLSGRTDLVGAGPATVAGWSRP
jgi:anthraniloyl-CoA monooxygenase